MPHPIREHKTYSGLWRVGSATKQPSTQKESWEESYDKLVDDDLWFPLPSNEYGDVEREHADELANNKKAIKDFVRSAISSAVRAREQEFAKELESIATVWELKDLCKKYAKKVGSL